MKQPHELQRLILHKLLFVDGLRYSKLKPKGEELENSQFMFHLKTLISEEFIIKNKNQYQLTSFGKEYANKIFSETGKIEFQAKITTVLCVRKKSGEILIYKRLKHPFFGHFGFPTEKVHLGENISDAAIRGLKEETGLISIPELFAIKHYKIFSPENELLEDKLMHGFIFQEINNEIKGNLEGDFFWVKEKDLKKVVKKPLLEFWDFYQSLKSFKDVPTFSEVSVKTNSF